MNIMGIDQSYTRTGVCIDTGDEGYFAKTIETQPDKDGPLDSYRRCNEIVSEILSGVVRYNIDLVVIEGISMGKSQGKSRDLAGLQYAIVCPIMRMHYVEVVIVPPKQLKKFATGDGSATKDKMVAMIDDSVREGMINDYPKTRGRYDIADAYWLVQYGHSLLDLVGE